MSHAKPRGPDGAAPDCIVPFDEGALVLVAQQEALEGASVAELRDEAERVARGGGDCAEELADVGLSGYKRVTGESLSAESCARGATTATPKGYRHMQDGDGTP